MRLLQANPSTDAKEDMRLQATWYAHHAGEHVAERYLAAFQQCVDSLCRMPSLGKARRFRHHRLSGLRSIKFGGKFDRHLIFFRVEGDVLQVFRVIHGHRDIPRRLLDPPGAED